MSRLITVVLSIVMTLSAFAEQVDEMLPVDDILQQEGEIIIEESELLKREQLREQDILRSIERINTRLESTKVAEPQEQIIEFREEDLRELESLAPELKKRAQSKKHKQRFPQDEDLLVIEDVFTFDKKAIKTKNGKTKAADKSVGIKGQEEALINQLDNSDLMDFERDLDIWSTDIEIKEELKERIDEF